MDELPDGLDEWVTWLIDTYHLQKREIAHCWRHHPPLVHELDALHSAWRDTVTPGARPTAALQWHEAFAATRLRLEQWTIRTGCASGTHRG